MVNIDSTREYLIVLEFSAGFLEPAHDTNEPTVDLVGAETSGDFL